MWRTRKRSVDDADRVVTACQRILAAGVVQDIAVEEIPLEDVIHRLFSSGGSFLDRKETALPPPSVP